MTKTPETPILWDVIDGLTTRHLATIEAPTQATAKAIARHLHGRRTVRLRVERAREQPPKESP